jgi:hypothetical protein
MFSALGQKLGSQVSPQGLQSIQLLIEELRAAAYAGLRNLVQPFLSIARGIAARIADHNLLHPGLQQ